MVVAFSGLLKVALTVVLVPTPAGFAGTVEVTLSGAAALIVMLNGLLTGASGLKESTTWTVKCNGPLATGVPGRRLLIQSHSGGQSTGAGNDGPGIRGRSAACGKCRRVGPSHGSWRQRRTGNNDERRGRHSQRSAAAHDASALLI